MKIFSVIKTLFLYSLIIFLMNKEFGELNISPPSSSSTKIVKLSLAIKVYMIDILNLF